MTAPTPVALPAPRALARPAQSNFSWLREQVRAHPLLLAAVALGVGARVVFWAMTGRVIDDALITISHARWAAEGLGLTHHPGEGHVHGFTSVLSVLVPLAGELVRPGGGLTALRLASLGASVASLVYGYRIAADLSLGRWAMAFLLAYLALDQDQIFFGMAGMETQMAVAVLLAVFSHLLRGQASRTGLALGLALLARPDFVLAVPPVLVALAWSDRRGALKATGLAAGLVAPWVVFATAYYGSPIPHTILAKATSVVLPAPHSLDPAAWGGWLRGHLVGHSAMWRFLVPFAESDSTAAAPIPTQVLPLIFGLMLALAMLGARATLARPRWWPAIVYLAAFAAYDFAALDFDYFGWYWPPALAVATILVAAGLNHVWERLPGPGAALSIGLALLFAVHIPFSFPLEARVQHRVEDRVRVPAGLYLAAEVPAGQVVAAEPAGYLEYYGRVEMYDFPGLTSPRSLETLRGLPPAERNLQGLIAATQPQWLVLRPGELDLLQARYPDVAARYTVVATFTTDETDPSGYLDQWGLRYRDVDATFYVLNRDSG